MGALGCRHVQSLCGLDPKAYRVVVCDPVFSRAEVQRKLATIAQDASAIRPNYCEFTEVDLLIDATDVRGRKTAMGIDASYRIIEKPIASSMVEMEDLDGITEANHIALQTVTVNYARRCWPLYQFLASSIDLGDIVSMSVCLNNGGLLSNVGHFLDRSNQSGPAACI